MLNALTWFDTRKDVGTLLLRMFIGVRLMYGVMDNVLSWEHMVRFKDFLHQFSFPFPLASAIVSVYMQLIAGIMIIAGWKIRYAAILMIIHFCIAVAVVHRSDSFEVMTPALAIIFCCILFLFQGAGYISLDKKMA